MIIFLLIIAILLIIVSNFIEIKSKKWELAIPKENILACYEKKNYVMTQTELKFYRELKTLTDKYNMTIFPQVNLEKIISAKDNNPKYRNRIKSRSIDFTIVNKKNCKILCCIELDDYTHNYKTRRERDNFINGLFINTGIKLYRVKVSNYYDKTFLENILLEYYNEDVINI